MLFRFLFIITICSNGNLQQYRTALFADGPRLGGGDRVNSCIVLGSRDITKFENPSHKELSVDRIVMPLIYVDFVEIVNDVVKLKLWVHFADFYVRSVGTSSVSNMVQ